jgi:hypothetical protein
MPSLEDLEIQPIKILLIGNSGAGKTGSLASLAIAGYRLFLCDFDNGIDVLLDEKILPKEFRKNIFVKSFYDRHAVQGGVASIRPKGVDDFIASISNWKEGEESLGNIYSWTTKDILIIDSLTFLGNACMNKALQLSGHLGQRPTIPDWGAAIDQQESIIELLYNPAVKCNVIITSHLRPLAAPEEGSIQRLYPSALGRLLPTKISRYFNNVVLVRRVGSGEKVRRELVTSVTADIELKVSKPSKIPAVMEQDLAKLFQLLQAN